MSAKFTPGAWISVYDRFDGNVITSQDRIDNSMSPVCKCDTDWSPSFSTEQQANSALIADAPAMYELLSEIVRTLQLPTGDLRNKCTAIVDRHEYDIPNQLDRGS